MKVELRQISKQFGRVQANREVSLTVEAGSIHGLLGENGAGKSTLAKILSGFLQPDRGEVWLDDRLVSLPSPAAAIAAGVGMLHQDPLDFPPLTVLENFLVGRSNGFWLNRAAATRQFRALANQFDFDLTLDERVNHLTVGERQQLELLRLLALGVQTLILDEPTTGISATQKTALFEAIRQLASQGKSVIFVSHKLEDVAVLCDRVTVMRQGEAVGHEEMPCDLARLVLLMFGKELALPAKPPTAQAAPLLTLRHLRLETDRFTVKLSDFTLRKGEVIGLAGLEGSGQQFLLQCCAGLLSPTAGEIILTTIAGVHHLTHQPYSAYRNAGIGYLPADRLKEGLIAGLSIQEHFALRASTTLQPGPFIHWPTYAHQVRRAIAQFSIRGQPTSRVEQLSGGNQQRTQLALLPVPLNLILMEHPTRGLDIESALWVWQQLIARCQGGTGILFMSSDLDELMQYSDRILVFSGGRVSEPLETACLTVETLGQAIGGQF